MPTLVDDVGLHSLAQLADVAQRERTDYNTEQSRPRVIPFAELEPSVIVLCEYAE